MTWTFIFMMFALKIPIIALLTIVWWAIKQQPEDAPAGSDDGGIKHHPHRRPRRRPPRGPRRGGPHGLPLPSSPPRVRTVTARRLVREHSR